MPIFECNEEDEELEPEKSSNKLVTLASIESLTFPLVQKVVLLADYRCKMCQDRVADIVSKLDGRMESIEIMTMEKKIVLTFTGKGRPTRGGKLETVAKNILAKISKVKRLLLSPST